MKNQSTFVLKKKEDGTSLSLVEVMIDALMVAVVNLITLKKNL